MKQDQSPIFFNEYLLLTGRMYSEYIENILSLKYRLLLISRFRHRFRYLNTPFKTGEFILIGLEMIHFKFVLGIHGAQYKIFIESFFCSFFGGSCLDL